MMVRSIVFLFNSVSSLTARQKLNQKNEEQRGFCPINTHFSLASEFELLEFLLQVFHFLVFDIHTNVQKRQISNHILFLQQDFLQASVLFLLKLHHVSLVLFNYGRAVLGAHAVVLRHSQVLCLEATVLCMYHRHLSSNAVQVALELVLHLTGQAGAVVADLLQLLPLLRAGEMKGDV